MTTSGLSANISYGNAIPTCILESKKCREADDSIDFIDASGDDHFIKEGNQNALRDSDVEKIVAIYRSRKTKDKYSYIAKLEEIAENDYNLNIPGYVDKEIAGYCRELRIAPPFRSGE